MKLHEELQTLLDRSLHAPEWAGFALLALAIAVTIPGRHGQRPLNAALLGGGAFALAFFGLRGVLHAWLPGVIGLLAGVLLALFGFVAVGWGTAFVLAGAFGAGGVLAAHALGMPAWGVAPLAAALGLAAGITNHKRLSVVLPPLFAAVFAALGAAICWAPHWRGAKLWQLNDVDWTLGLTAALALPLLALALEREYRKKLRLKARTKAMDDEELQKKIEAKKTAYQRAFEHLQTMPEDEKKD